MFCTGCGQPVLPVHKFCPRCGTPVGDALRANSDAEPRQVDAAVGDQQSNESISQPPAVAPSPMRAVDVPDSPPEPVDFSVPFSSYAEPPARKSRLPMLIALLTVFIIGGGIIAYWIFQTSMTAGGSRSANVAIALAPQTAQVVAGNALDFEATLTGATDDEVVWSVQEGSSGGRVVTRGARAGGGKVSLLAVYIAPKNPGMYHLLVTSKADPTKSASAEITVTPH